MVVSFCFAHPRRSTTSSFLFVLITLTVLLLLPYIYCTQWTTLLYPVFQHLNSCMLYTTEAKRPRNIQTQPCCCCNLLFLPSTLGGASIILFSPFVLLNNISDQIVRCPIVVPCSSKSITITFQTQQLLKLFQIWIYIRSNVHLILRSTMCLLHLCKLFDLNEIRATMIELINCEERKRQETHSSQS
jgi:hypothetical protein